MTPQKFNQNSTSENSVTAKFSCFPTIEEEGAGKFSDAEDTQSEIDPEEVEFDTQSEIDTEEAEYETTFQGIYSITEERGKPFAAWQPYIPPEPVFRNSPAQSWRSVSSLPEYSSLEPTPPGSQQSTIQLQGKQSNQLKYQWAHPYQNPNETDSSAQLEIIQANNQALQAQVEHTLARIEQNVQKNKELAERISRSPRAIKTIQALEAAIAIFGQDKHEPKYEVSEYATGNRRWKWSPTVHPVLIQDLLLYDVRNKHNQNKILGDKVAQVVRQNTQLAQEISSAYETPSEKLKKDPIMALVTKTVATYMFIRHSNGPKRNNNPGTEDFSSWEQPFFKKKEWKWKWKQKQKNGENKNNRFKDKRNKKNESERKRERKLESESG
jgi:hypothetical protein